MGAITCYPLWNLSYMHQQQSTIKQTYTSHKNPLLLNSSLEGAFKARIFLAPSTDQRNFGERKCYPRQKQLAS